NLVEEEEGLDHYVFYFETCPFQQGTRPSMYVPLMPQELHRVRYVLEVICKNQFQTSIDEIPKLQVENSRSNILSRVIKGLALLLKSRKFLFKCYDTRAASSESVMLCCCGGGGSGRVVVVVDIVAVKTGA
ncbi:hypothetical protein Tco_0995787, partial [Tanacetum coccineum]